MDHSRPALLVLFLLLVSGFQFESSPSAGSVEQFVNRLDQRIPDILEEFHVPGVAVALVHEAVPTWSRGYGLANLEQKIPVNDQTIFQAASVSKAITTWGVLRLVETGRLDLDAPVETYLTRWHLPPSDYDHDEVTTRRLLSHTSGMSGHGYRGTDPDEPLPILEQTLSGDGIVREPGSAFAYANPGFALLTLVVEEVTGESFSAFMEREVLGPLGMAHSSYGPTDELRRFVATGHDENGKPLPDYRFSGAGCCGLRTTAPDLALFLAAYMGGPGGEPAGRSVISPGAVNMAMEPVAHLRGDVGFLLGEDSGMGLLLETLPGGQRLVLHTGSNRGWRAVMMAVPAAGEGIVVLTNGAPGGLHVWAEVVRMWSDWTGLGRPKTCRVLAAIGTVTWIAAVVLGAGALAWCWRIYHQVRNRRRTWMRRASWTRILFRSLGILAGVVFVLGWWVVINPILEMLAPGSAPWLTAALTLIVAAAITGALSSTRGQPN